MNDTAKIYDDLAKLAGRLLSRGASKGEIGLAMLRSGGVFLTEHGGADLLAKACTAVLEEMAGRNPGDETMRGLRQAVQRDVVHADLLPVLRLLRDVTWRSDPPLRKDRRTEAPAMTDQPTFLAGAFALTEHGLHQPERCRVCGGHVTLQRGLGLTRDASTGMVFVYTPSSLWNLTGHQQPTRYD